VQPVYPVTSLRDFLSGAYTYSCYNGGELLEEGTWMSKGRAAINSNLRRNPASAHATQAGVIAFVIFLARKARESIRELPLDRT
jgi:hypothetical protein